MNGFFERVSFWLCISIISLPASAQDETWHPRYSISLSLHYSQIVDENVKAVSFTGPGAGASLRRWMDGDFFYQYLEAGGYVSLPKTATEKSSRSALGNANLKYGFNLKRAFGSEHVSVGLFALGSVREAYYKNYKSNNLFWANFIGLGGNLTVEEPLSEKYAFQAVFDIPLMGVVYRTSLTRKPPAKNTVKYVLNSNFSDANLGSPGNYLNPCLSLGILTSARSGLRSISYEYCYIKAKTAASGAYRENAHSLSFTFKIFN